MDARRAGILLRRAELVRDDCRRQLRVLEPLAAAGAEAPEIVERARLALAECEVELARLDVEGET